jgi:hypothetical protein
MPQVKLIPLIHNFKFKYIMKTINLAYIRRLYDYLFALDDDWTADNFDMNLPADRAMFFTEAKKVFQKSGPKTQARTIEAMEYILSQPDIEKYWRQVIPHDLPASVFSVSDKTKYLHDLFVEVVGREPNINISSEDVTLLYLLTNWHPSE